MYFHPNNNDGIFMSGKQTGDVRVGDSYPLAKVRKEGVSMSLLRGNDILSIVTPFTPLEAHILEFGSIEFGWIYEKGALLLVFRFFSKIYTNLKVSFSCPFDVRTISRDQLVMPKEITKEGFCISIHVIDKKTNKLMIVKTLFLTQEQAVALFSVIQDQFCELRSSDDIYAVWSCKPLNELIETADMLVIENLI